MIKARSFPNLRRLEWAAEDLETLATLTYFMHDKVESLLITFSDDLAADPARSLSSFVFDTIKRAPYLGYLDISGDEWIGPQILHLLRGLKKLEEVTIPCFCATSEVLQELSSRVMLKTITFSGDGDMDMRLYPNLTAAAFPSLETLILRLHMSDLIHMFKSDVHFERLTMLCLNEAAYSRTGIIQELLGLIATKCPVLKTLYLDTDYQAPENQEDEAIPVSLDDLKPLMQCRLLESFTLRHDRALGLTDGDVEVLARALPGLIRINLNADPPEEQRPAMTLQSLVTFVSHCLRLEELGLYMDGTSAGDVVIPEHGLPFYHLEGISVGASHISDPPQVAALLARIIHPGCVLRKSWQSTTTRRPMLDKWTEVRNLLPTMLRLVHDVRSGR